MAKTASRERQEEGYVIESLDSNEKVTRSSGNVFRDLDLPNPEERLAKAKLVQIIAEVIAEKGLSQSKAARLVGVDQPTLSKLLNGRTSAFSMERLFSVLVLLGQDVDINVRTHSAEQVGSQIAVGRI